MGGADSFNCVVSKFCFVFLSSLNKRAEETGKDE